MLLQQRYVLHFLLGAWMWQRSAGQSIEEALTTTDRLVFSLE